MEIIIPPMKHPKHISHVRGAIIVGLFATVAATASYALIVSDDDLPKLDSTKATYSLLIPPLQSLNGVEGQNLSKKPQNPWLVHTVQPGETLGQIFSHHGLSSADLKDVLGSGEAARELKALTPGHVLKLRTKNNGQLKKLVYRQTPAQSIVVARSKKGVTSKVSEKRVDRELTRVGGIINNSLFYDGKRAGLTDKLIIQLANIFGWDIDFAWDLRDGDSFTVVYETLYVKGEQVGTSDILAAEFVNHGKTYQAFRYTDEQGRPDYYTSSGQAMHKAFLRTPVEFSRISSYFSLARNHPILNTIRAHKGVDYAAPTGTPVRSTGNGKIVFAGTQSGYGNVVVVEHGRQYSTLYGHLSRFARLKVGSPVHQGEIIGYVGQTGMATGPHLHYEFRVAGQHQNPLTVALPEAEPIKPKQMQAFKHYAHPFLAELTRFHKVTVAQVD